MDRGPRNNPFARDNVNPALKTLDDVRLASAVQRATQPTPAPAATKEDNSKSAISADLLASLSETAPTTSTVVFSGGITAKPTTPTSTPAPTPTPVPASSTSNVSPNSTPMLETAKPIKKKPNKVFLIVISVVLLIGIVFAVWFFVYYNSTNVVVRDAFNNLYRRTADDIKFNLTTNPGNDAGSVSVSGNTKYNANRNALSADGEFVDDGQSIKAGLDFVADSDKGELYFRVRTSEQTDKMITASDQTGVVGSIVSQVTDKWLSFKLSDLSKLPQTSDASPAATKKAVSAYNDYQKCLLDHSYRLQGDRELRSDLLEAIQSAKAFNLVRSGDKNGQRIDVTIKSSQIKPLIENVQKSKYSKLLGDCTKRFAKNMGTEISDKDMREQTSDMAKGLNDMIETYQPKLSFWVTIWGHQPTRLALTSKTKGDSYTVSTDLTAESTGQTPTIDLPSSATPVVDIVNSVVNQLSTGQMPTTQTNDTGVSLDSATMSALQIKQRNDARLRDVSSVVEAITSYTSNNPGAYLTDLEGLYYGPGGNRGSLDKYIGVLSNNTTGVNVVRAGSLDEANRKVVMHKSLTTIEVYPGFTCSSDSSLAQGTAKQAAVIAYNEVAGGQEINATPVCSSAN